MFISVPLGKKKRTPIIIFVAGTLPWRVRISEVDGGIERGGNQAMLGELRAVIQQNGMHW